MLKRQALGIFAGVALVVIILATAVVGLLLSRPGQSTCEYNGRTYQIGEGFKSSDGCNECGCNANGQVACTLRACVN